MAITKILNIGSAKNGGSGHLYNAIRYIMNGEKTEGGLYIGGNAGSSHSEVYRTMLQTKRDWEKLDKRQGYHFVLSWEPGEASADQAYQVIQEFCEEYLGDNYDYVFSVHTDQKHMHGHIIFNSVNRRSGYKYRYEKGDWEKQIQPVTDRICEKYGLKRLEYDKGKKKGKSYAEHFAEKEGRPTWTKIIKADIDSVISVSASFDDFLSQMNLLGYEIKQRKYITYIPPGGEKGRRDSTLGEGYTREDITERILQKTQKGIIEHTDILSPRLRRAYDAGIQKLVSNSMSTFQKRKVKDFYFAGHYLEERNPFAVNQKEIRKSAIRIDRMYEECTYLLQNQIRSPDEIYEKLRQLRRRETFLKKERSTQYIHKNDPVVKEYQRLKDRLETLPEWDDTFEELQEELLELENRMPSGFQTAYEKQRQIRRELTEVRKEIKVAERLKLEYEQTQQKEPEQVVNEEILIY